MKAVRSQIAVKKPISYSYTSKRTLSSNNSFRPVFTSISRHPKKAHHVMPPTSQHIPCVQPQISKASLTISATSLNNTKSQQPTVHSIYEPKTGTWQYLVADFTTLQAIIIDPVLDYDACTHTISTRTADSLISMIAQHGYTISKILETHAHADHLTAASYLQHRLEKIQSNKPPICIGKRITQIQEVFGARYGVKKEEWNGVFDELFEDGEEFEIGKVRVRVVHLPGHTPDHVGYIVGDNVFCGDSIFHADIGTARCDFPGGNARDLYRSVQKLMHLPDHVKIWTGHDYVSKEREEPVAWTSVREHKERNKWLAQDIKIEQFVERRMEKDRRLAAPKLLHPSLQVNIRAGRLPSLTNLGHRFLSLPLRVEGGLW
ncbi:beta-lactamase-like protein [Phaeosphaeria sp. MPI-PUGE-AT-0046c]|nr:beta-lactamase-like protein [Phaeosphaeria sp. MPI-PUGE-AT-0046c]